MFKLFFKSFLLAAPAIGIACLYWVADPFRVIYTYNQTAPEYNDLYKDIPVNRDYESTEFFIKEYPKQKFNSFIFGSSRSQPYRCRDWKTYLDSSAVCFHYDAFSEDLIGVYQKVKFLDKMNVHIKNCLWITERNMLNTKEAVNSGLLYTKHPALSGKSWIDFETAVMNNFFTNFYWLLFIERGIQDNFFICRNLLNFDPYSKLLRDTFDIDPVTNDYYYTSYDRKIKEDSLAFYKVKFGREPKVTPDSVFPETKPVIQPKDTSLFQEMNAIFKKHKTNLKIVISPEYGLGKLNSKDLALLQKCFGTSVVFDYNQANDITSRPGNYYDVRHARLNVSRRIMKEIYSTQPPVK